MLFGLDIVEILLILPTLLISLTFHEFMHGWVAYKLGDMTAKNNGRLTLNPIAHIDPIGAIALLIAHFGWAKPVPVNPYNFKKPRRDMAIVGLGGPLANFILATVGIIIQYILLLFFINVKVLQSDFTAIALKMLSYFIIININLAMFNLIPFPPLDGSKVLYAVLPDRAYFSLMKYERYGFIALIILVYLGTFSGFISTVSSIIYSGISFVVGAFFSIFGLKLY